MLPLAGRSVLVVRVSPHISVSCLLNASSSHRVLCLFCCSLVSVIRGQVLTGDGTPLIGVNVSFLHYPEYGYTVTRQDGM